jgi:hypothetical protein
LLGRPDVDFFFSSLQILWGCQNIFPLSALVIIKSSDDRISQLAILIRIA